MALWLRIALGVVFLALVLGLIRWKRPKLWGKLSKPFLRTSRTPHPEDPSNPQ